MAVLGGEGLLQRVSPLRRVGGGQITIIAFEAGGIRGNADYVRVPPVVTVRVRCPARFEIGSSLF